MLKNGQRYIETGIANPAPDQQIPFAIVDDEDEDTMLVTNADDAELVYTRLITTTGKYPALFIEALSWKLAYELTFALPVRAPLALQMANGYAAALDRAAASVFKHQTPSPPPRPKALRVR